MTVPASLGGLPSPSPCLRGTLARTRAPSTWLGTGLQPSSEEMPSCFLILGNVSTSDPREGKRGAEEARRGGPVCPHDWQGGESQRLRGREFSRREGVRVKRRMGIGRKGDQHDGGRKVEVSFLLCPGGACV